MLCSCSLPLGLWSFVWKPTTEFVIVFTSFVHLPPKLSVLCCPVSSIRTTVSFYSPPTPPVFQVCRVRGDLACCSILTSSVEGANCASLCSLAGPRLLFCFVLLRYISLWIEHFFFFYMFTSLKNGLCVIDDGIKKIPVGQLAVACRSHPFSQVCGCRRCLPPNVHIGFRRLEESLWDNCELLSYSLWITCLSVGARGGGGSGMWWIRHA